MRSWSRQPRVNQRFDPKAVAEAACGTIRLKLLKIGALVRVGARRVAFAMASGCPYAEDWRSAAARLACARASH